MFNFSCWRLVPTSLGWKRRSLKIHALVDNSPSKVNFCAAAKVPFARMVKREAGASPALCPQL
jgi:hypothetical protein